MIADLQFRLERMAKKPTPTKGPERRGGRRDRHDARMVILDEDRITLTEAAHRLGLSTSALHWRLVGRCGKDYQEPDVRGVGADKVRREPIQKVL